MHGAMFYLATTRRFFYLADDDTFVPPEHLKWGRKRGISGFFLQMSGGKRVKKTRY